MFSEFEFPTSLGTSILLLDGSARSVIFVFRSDKNQTRGSVETWNSTGLFFFYFIKPRLHYQSFLVQENLVKVFFMRTLMM